MSLGWKRFSFFDTDDRRGVEVPGSSTASSGNAYHLAFGCSDGQVGLNPSHRAACPTSIVPGMCHHTPLMTAI